MPRIGFWQTGQRSGSTCHTRRIRSRHRLEGNESLTDQFTVLAEDHARVEPGVWQRAGRAINQRERLRLRYQRFDGATRDYLLEPYHLAAYHGNWYLLALCASPPARMNDVNQTNPIRYATHAR